MLDDVLARYCGSFYFQVSLHYLGSAVVGVILRCCSSIFANESIINCRRIADVVRFSS